MGIKKVKITDKIFLLIFENQHEIASTFLRFQEHYESPKFRGKSFSLGEFKAWYSSLKGDFTYYTDWNGFNIPSYILKPFYEGQFDPISDEEKEILNLFRDVGDDFYVIGIHKDMKNVSSFLKHEIAHGLFYTDSQYKDRVMEILSEFNLDEIKDELRSKGGYHEEVLDDEVHAYSLGSVGKLKSKVPEELHKRLLENYQKAFLENNAHIPDLE